MFSRLVRTPRLLQSAALRASLPAFLGRAAASDVVATNDSAKEKEKYLLLLQEGLTKPYEGPERDLVNFPRVPRAIQPGKIRMGFAPEEWFQIFYKKTGVTGPYLFGGGLITFLLSKELFVIEDEFSTGVAMFILMYTVIKKFGPIARTWADKTCAEDEASFEAMKTSSVTNLEEAISRERDMQWRMEASQTLIQAKRENVAMQLETEYRSRIMGVFQQVKKRLDYHLEMDTTRRQLEQKHMVDWIVRSVLQSISPQQEKEALKKCVEDLRLLSARAAI